MSDTPIDARGRPALTRSAGFVRAGGQPGKLPMGSWHEGSISANSKLTLDTFARNIGFTPNITAAFARSPIAFNS